MKLLRQSELLTAARSSLAVYCLAVQRRFQLPTHITRLIATLEQVEAGACDRVAIAMPPRHGKTNTAAELFPAWYLGRHPERSVITATYGEARAQDLGRRVQRLLQSAMHQAIFPKAGLRADIGSAERLEFEAGGSYFAVSRSGSLTGRGADLLICDDLLKDQQEASSPAIRAQVQDFYERVALTRLEPAGAVAMISTRWHEADLIGYVLQQNAAAWTSLNFPALAEANDPLGREEGEALWPERFSARHLAQKRLEIGARAFMGLYQGRPSEAQGTIFKRDWWRTYSAIPELKRTIISADTAFKTTSAADYSAIQVWGESQTGFYLLAAWKQRVEYPELKRALLSFADQWKPNWVLVEDAASGQSLLQELRGSTSLPLKPIKVDRDKVSRAEACTGMLEAGRVYVPEGNAKWVADFLDELSGFPAAAHDDQVDACTMALNFLRGESGRVPWVEVLDLHAPPAGPFVDKYANLDPLDPGPDRWWQSSGRGASFGGGRR
jgi:predicted phage terminase large subunit-like protein